MGGKDHRVLLHFTSILTGGSYLELGLAPWLLLWESDLCLQVSELQESVANFCGCVADPKPTEKEHLFIGSDGYFYPLPSLDASEAGKQNANSERGSQLCCPLLGDLGCQYSSADAHEGKGMNRKGEHGKQSFLKSGFPCA